MWLSLRAETLVTLQRMDLLANPGPFFFTPTEENKRTRLKHPFPPGVVGFVSLTIPFLFQEAGPLQTIMLPFSGINTPAFFSPADNLPANILASE